jgi:2-dehydro-3-deoxyphosphogluconate aldolase / (4S)-4-hydroxy-2-oxoglutarate aldolase
LTAEDHSEFLTALKAERIVAVLRSKTARQAVEAGKALIDQGIRIVEVSLNTPGAIDAIAQLAEYGADVPGCVVGAGTILDAVAAEDVAAAGARFYVSPAFDAGTVAAAAEYGMAAIPGCLTPTEMLWAHRAGAAAIKVFPATAWSPEGLANVVRAMPFLHLIPTGGVDADAATRWLEAGAAGLGIGSALERPGAVRRLREAIAPYQEKELG